ncbi:MAG: hypothetical protein GY750_16040 [Lentisphaerae bacterium]|nr:hypothetical protein [Lentisphaerota bacterium]
MSLSVTDVQKTCSSNVKKVINSYARYMMKYNPSDVHEMLQYMGCLNQESKNQRDIIALMQMSKKLRNAETAKLDSWIAQIQSCCLKLHTSYANTNSCNPQYDLLTYAKNNPLYAVINKEAIRKANAYNNRQFKTKTFAYKAFIKDRKNWRIQNPTWKTDKLKYRGKVKKKPAKKVVPQPIYYRNPNDYCGGGFNGISIYLTDIRYDQTFFQEIGLGEWGNFLWYLFGGKNVYKLFSIDKPTNPNDFYTLGLHEIDNRSPTQRLLATNSDYSYDDYMRCRQEYDDC